jgi:glutathione synthase/RimK-type ligase-like ATP-grasp enzyme
MSIHIVPYDMKSEGALVLKEVIGTKFVKRRNSNYCDKAGRLLINWGSSVVNIECEPHRILNKPQAVSNAINKTKAYKCFTDYGVPTPKLLSMFEVAMVIGGGGEVVQRNIDNGKDGDGLSIIGTEKEYNSDAAMHTEYCKISSEYRVVVFKEKVLCIHKKLCKERIKTSSNGVLWSIRKTEAFSAKFNKVCIDAVKALGLDFGGIDIAMTDKGLKVFEVNSALEVTPMIRTKLCNEFNAYHDREV